MVIHDAGQARAALAAAGPAGALLLSAPGAALALGAPWFLAMLAAAAASHPRVPCLGVLDCDAAPGLALAALRQGARGLVLAEAAPGRDAVLALAQAAGATLLAARPPALDLATLRYDSTPGAARLRAWLATHGDE